MLTTMPDTCGCRLCATVIQPGERLSWIDGIGPYHVRCSPSQSDKDLAALEEIQVKIHMEKLQTQARKNAIYRTAKRYFSRSFDFLCFVVGPILIAANISEYFERKIYRSADAEFYLTAGVGLLAFGFLRAYWSKMTSNK